MKFNSKDATKKLLMRLNDHLLIYTNINDYFIIEIPKQINQIQVL